AVATASLILGIAGCAMSTQPASTDQTDTAGLSREATDNSQASMAQADTSTASTMPSTTAAALPVTASGQWAEPAPVAAPLVSDTAAIPPADQAPMASTTPAPSTDMPATTTTSTTTDPMPSSEQALPPRSDRN
ncbi:MAG: hypothetical protein ABIP59_05565, partial [Roseateles sp.]